MVDLSAMNPAVFYLGVVPAAMVVAGVLYGIIERWAGWR